jgi:N-acetylglucosamine-6-sulfatase
MHVNSTTAEFEGQTYANYMKQAGYTTGYFGKYLNPPVRLVPHLRGHWLMTAIDFTCMPERARKRVRVRALQAMEIYCRLNGSHFPGWDRFMGMCNTAYYDVHWNDGGTLTFTGSDPEDYTTSIVGNRTVAFIREVAAASLAEGGKPFLAVAATRAPHSPQTPAPVR